MTERPSIVIDLHPDTRRLLERLVVALERREDTPLISSTAARPSPMAEDAHASSTTLSFPPFGLRRGEPIHGASQEDLRFYANASLRELRDPSKRRFHAQERERLDAYNAELRRQGVGPVDEGSSS